MNKESERRPQREELPLSKAAELLLEECRMVLPGIQALFGFQLIAVFNAGFSQRLSPGDQRIHVAAITLVVLAIAIIMTPATYHRQSGPEQITRSFIRISTRLLLASMLPLAVGICLDFYLVVASITGRLVGICLASVVSVAFTTLWLLLPRVRTLQRVLGATD
jgi:hypothetical protein